jgi:hypothetical protein
MMKPSRSSPSVSGPGRSDQKQGNSPRNPAGSPKAESQSHVRSADKSASDRADQRAKDGEPLAAKDQSERSPKQENL